jgi:hypothetical protein
MPKDEIEIESTPGKASKFKKAPIRGRPPGSTKIILPGLNQIAAGKDFVVVAGSHVLRTLIECYITLTKQV